jgi:hypothetical protein
MTRPSRSVAPGTSSRFRTLLAAVLALLGFAAPTTLAAQQFFTDDATLANFPACQLEAWRSGEETRFEPACRLVRDLEVTLGLGFNPERRERLENYTLELKTGLRELRPGGFGISVVAGLDFDARPDDETGEFAGAFAYVPATLSIGEDRLLLHANLGWHFGRNAFAVDDPDAADDEREHTVLMGVRGDLELPWLDERFVVVGELFGEGMRRPVYQVGLRTRVIPDRLIVDVSWGGNTAPGEQGKGWIFGFGWTPPRLL